jgi:hypothetical protein
VIPLEREVLSEWRGAEAVALYGVCACEKATLQNQTWYVVRESRLERDGHISTHGYVRCALCRRPLGWWDRA